MTSERSTTRYEEIASDLRRRIQAGEFPASSRLPSYEELTASYSASRATVRSAIELLKSEGVLRTVMKSGVLVRDPGTRRRVQRGSTVRRDPARGYVFPAASSAGEPWVMHGQPRAALTPIPASVATHLGVEAGTEVMRRRRVTSPKGEPPFQIADAWISPTALAEAPQAGEPVTGPGGYLDRLEEAGHGPLSWVEVTRTRLPSREEARLLEIPTTMPVMEVSTIGTSARTGEPVEVSVRVVPADRVEIVSELRRDRSARWPVEPADTPRGA
jgi:GntR family transcriptional regulator